MWRMSLECSLGHLNRIEEIVQVAIRLQRKVTESMLMHQPRLQPPLQIDGAIGRLRMRETYCPSEAGRGEYD